MKIHSLADIPNALFYPLKEWAQASSLHWNIFVGSAMLLLLAALVGTLFFIRKLGAADERTNGYYKNWAFTVLIAIFVCDTIFPKDYLMNQFFVYKYAIAFLAGDVYMFLQYRKDFQ
ncbi:DUF2178 domain-containing protein [Enterococcus hirae]|nr:DUF2178 domain-containing protein [Enterococcus hirae]